tara:strand:+ start:111 stop:356 length:246 start_codon:yes stop_codon:yes gene_type:complete
LLLLNGSKIQAQFAQEKRISATENYIKNQVIRILVSEAVSMKSIKTDLTLCVLNPREPVLMPSTTDTFFEIRITAFTPFRV